MRTSYEVRLERWISELMSPQLLLAKISPYLRPKSWHMGSTPRGEVRRAKTAVDQRLGFRRPLVDSVFAAAFSARLVASSGQLWLSNVFCDQGAEKLISWHVHPGRVKLRRWKFFCSGCGKRRIRECLSISLYLMHPSFQIIKVELQDLLGLNQTQNSKCNSL